MYTVLPQDEEMISLYRDILPRRIFDAHAHFYAKDTIPGTQGRGSFLREECGISDYKSDMAPFYPGVATLAVHAVPMPDRALHDTQNGLRERINAYARREATAHPDCVASAYLHKDDEEETIETFLSDHHVRALKCYWYAAGKANGEDCMIREFLPEAAWRVSARRGIPILLHIMHEGALADERNLNYIKSMARKYPDAKLVLAHCARAFASYTGVFAIPALSAYENIWFDFAAITEPSAMIACIKATKAKRVMWGTDYPICMFRGKPVSLGRGFHWLAGKDYPPQIAPALLITESLLALKQAALLCDLDASDLADIFDRNARALFGMPI